MVASYGLLKHVKKHDQKYRYAFVAIFGAVFALISALLVADVGRPSCFGGKAVQHDVETKTLLSNCKPLTTGYLASDDGQREDREDENAPEYLDRSWGSRLKRSLQGLLTVTMSDWAIPLCYYGSFITKMGEILSYVISRLPNQIRFR